MKSKMSKIGMLFALFMGLTACVPVANCADWTDWQYYWERKFTVCYQGATNYVLKMYCKPFIGPPSYIIRTWQEGVPGYNEELSYFDDTIRFERHDLRWSAGGTNWERDQTSSTWGIHNNTSTAYYVWFHMNGAEYDPDTNHEEVDSLDHQHYEYVGTQSERRIIQTFPSHYWADVVVNGTENIP